MRTSFDVKRFGGPVALSAALLAVAALPAAAEKPSRGCTDDFALMSVLEFRAYLHSDVFLGSLPPEGQAIAPDILAIVDSDAWLAAGAAYDKNGDGLLCLKQKTATPGHLNGWSFNAVDDTSNG